MRTAPILLFVVAFATGVLIFQLAGVADVFSAGDPTDDLESGERFEEQASDQGLEQGEDDEGFTASVMSAADDTLAGFIIKAVSIAFGFMRLVVLLPVELQNLGAPRWAAYPLGLFAQTFGLFGLAQFMSGRVYR
jgi:hypothetical protein